MIQSDAVGHFSKGCQIYPDARYMKVSATVANFDKAAKQGNKEK